MAEEKYKQKSKCRYYFSCPIYNSSILNTRFEEEMCGTGKNKDDSYIPKIPQHDEIYPVKDWELWPEGPCPAFKCYLSHSITSFTLFMTRKLI